MTRRVARLFRPYRGRLAAVLALIALSAGLVVYAVAFHLLRIPEARQIENFVLGRLRLRGER